MEDDEAVRAARLLEAQHAAAELFRAIGAEGVLRPGVWDSEASREVTELAADRFGVERHWHKRIVRSGPNTLQPYTVDPPDREMTDDDIVFADFGPVFDGWEADFGRTWVLGDDPAKLRLRDDLAPVFAAGKAFFEAHPAVTAAELYAEVVRLAEERGWEFGNMHCGHVVGEFPHQNMEGGRLDSLICASNHRRLRGPDPSGRVAHWILEVHLVDRPRQIGGFFEELPTLGASHRPAC
jgi:Xaa-Pro aminopeptidase